MDRSQTVCSGGTATAALYIGNGCQVLAARGSGVGDGVTCISLPSVDQSGTFSAYIDCSAPGPDPALSSGAKMGIIAGSVVGGVLLLGCLAWCCYRSHKRNAAVLHSHSIHMGASQLQYVPPDAYAQHRGGPNVNNGRLAQLAQPLSGSMMALVSCIALIQAMASMEGVSAATAAATSTRSQSPVLADFFNFGDNCPGAWWKAAPSVWLYFAAPILRIADAAGTSKSVDLSSVTVVGAIYLIVATAALCLCLCLCGCGKGWSFFSSVTQTITLGVGAIALRMWPAFAYAAWLQRNYPAWCYGFISFNISNIICGVAPMMVFVGMLHVIAWCSEALQRDRIQSRKRH